MCDNRGMFTHEIPQPAHRRYSSKPFPAYRFVLGENPHPTADPEGHSYGKEDNAQILTTENWRTNKDYLYGIDLYNYAYWWETHESLEGLWAHFPRGVPESNLLQGLIKIAAGLYKWHLQDAAGAAHHYDGGTKLLKEAMEHSKIYMGIDLPGYLDRLAKHFKKAPAGDPLVDYPFIDLKI